MAPQPAEIIGSARSRSSRSARSRSQRSAPALRPCACRLCPCRAGARCCRTVAARRWARGPSDGAAARRRPSLRQPERRQRHGLSRTGAGVGADVAARDLPGSDRDLAADNVSGLSCLTSSAPRKTRRRASCSTAGCIGCRIACASQRSFTTARPAPRSGRTRSTRQGPIRFGFRRTSRTELIIRSRGSTAPFAPASKGPPGRNRRWRSTNTTIICGDSSTTSAQPWRIR